MGLSILTLALDRRLHLRRLIEGLVRSQVRPDELLIVDMGGPQIDLPFASFPIRVLPLKHGGLQLAKARNLAALQSHGDFLVFLDVDCIPMAGLLGAIRNALEVHDALVCAEVRYLEKNAIRGDWNEDDLLQNSISHPVRSFPTAGLREESNAGLFWSLAFGIRSKLFTKLGGFDERFMGYGAEDTDFGFRACRSGVDLLFLGGEAAFHQFHEVCNPPLQHFDDIIRNAELFHEIWGVWPMQGWLESFESLQLIRRKDDKIFEVRRPNVFEVKAAAQGKTRY